MNSTFILEVMRRAQYSPFGFFVELPYRSYNVFKGFEFLDKFEQGFMWNAIDGLDNVNEDEVNRMSPIQ